MNFFPESKNSVSAREFINQFFYKIPYEKTWKEPLGEKRASKIVMRIYEILFTVGLIILAIAKSGANFVLTSYQWNVLNAMTIYPAFVPLVMIIPFMFFIAVFNARRVH